MTALSSGNINGSLPWNTGACGTKINFSFGLTQGSDKKERMRFSCVFVVCFNRI